MPNLIKHFPRFNYYSKVIFSSLRFTEYNFNTFGSLRFTECYDRILRARNISLFPGGPGRRSTLKPTASMARLTLPLAE